MRETVLFPRPTLEDGLDFLGPHDRLDVDFLAHRATAARVVSASNMLVREKVLHGFYRNGRTPVPDDTKREKGLVESDESGYPRAQEVRHDQRVPSAKVVLNCKAQTDLGRPQRLIDESVPSIHRSFGERL